MNLDLTFYFKLFVRRLPVMAFFVIVASSLSVISALKLPETWRSDARLLLEAAQIPDNMVRSTVQTNAVEQLDIIQQRLTTRTNLIDIANKQNVFPNIRTMEPDTVVSSMRSAIKIRRTTGRNRATVLNISFEARSGQIAANVVNDLVTIVLEENARFRLSRTENTLGFFEDEVEQLSDELSQISARISQFKSDNVNALPENQNYRLSRQRSLQERLGQLEREQASLKAQREDIIEAYEVTGLVSDPEGQGPRTASERRLAKAMSDLDQSLTIYSESHPRVVSLKGVIDRLEEQVAADLKDMEVVDEEGAPSITNARLQTTLIEIDTRLSFLAEDITNISNELTTLKDGIERSAQNAIILNEQQRAFASISSRYNTAVKNLNAAKMSERIESTAQGERITVIETASVPRVPAGPNRPKVALMGVAAGIGLACAYFILLELLNRTIRRPAEIVSRFNITPITTIPYMESRRHRMLRRGAILGVTLFVVVTIPFGLWYVDTNYLPLETVVQKGLTKLGLG